MSTRVSVVQRAVTDVRVSVQVLWISGLWYNGVGAGPAAEFGVIPPDAHLDQLNVTVVSLARKPPVGRRGAPHVARLAVWPVPQLTVLGSARIGC